MSDGVALFVGWQDEMSRQWHPVGRLRQLPGGLYEFVYTRGFLAARKAGMQPLLGFDDAFGRYLSDELFPLFGNRVMSRTRSDYASYVRRLDLPEDTAPVLMLARSEGRRNTDPFVVFPEPSLTSMDRGQLQYDLTFFVHGVRYMPDAAQRRVDALGAADRLWPMWDWENPRDVNAITLRTEDNHMLGWLPRYYAADVQRLRASGCDIDIRVVKVNSIQEPHWARLLCRLRSAAPPDFRPLADAAFEPLAAPELLAANI